MKLRILFLTDDREDYLADSVLHGLRQLEDIEVIDYPRKDSMYSDISEYNQSSLRGGGFTLYGLLKEPKIAPQRNQIWNQLLEKKFDLVVISNIWRQWGTLLQYDELLVNQKIVLLDGDDDERYYPTSGSRLRKFGFGTGLRHLLKAKTTYMFKREITSKTNFNRRNIQLHPIAFAIPEEKISKQAPIKTKMFPEHIVDKELSGILNATVSYAFNKEKDYREDLGNSRFGVTTKRGGWECLRHYEIAASGTIQCFKNLDEKPSECAPHGLKHLVNCISYRNSDDLMTQLKLLSKEDELKIQKASLQWARLNNTKQRALEVLRIIGL